MGIDTLALTDHDGLYGVVRIAEAAKQVGARTAFGAKLAWTCPARRTASRTRPAPTCWSWPAVWPVTGGWPECSPRRACAGSERAPGLRPGRDSQRAFRARPGAHRQSQGPVRLAWSRMARRRRKAARPAIGRVVGRRGSSPAKRGNLTNRAPATRLQKGLIGTTQRPASSRAQPTIFTRPRVDRRSIVTSGMTCPNAARRVARPRASVEPGRGPVNRRGPVNNCGHGGERRSRGVGRGRRVAP